MQEAGLVHDRQPVEQRLDQRRDLRLRERAVRLHPVGKRRALDEFHHHVGGAVRLEEAHHAHDVRMAERRHGARLVEKAPLAPVERVGGGRRARRDRIVGAARGDVVGQVFLDRDLEVEVRVGREVGQPEAAHAEHALDAVFLQRVARGKGIRGARGHVTPCRSARWPSPGCGASG